MQIKRLGGLSTVLVDFSCKRAYITTVVTGRVSASNRTTVPEKSGSSVRTQDGLVRDASLRNRSCGAYFRLICMRLPCGGFSPLAVKSTNVANLIGDAQSAILGFR